MMELDGLMDGWMATYQIQSVRWRVESGKWKEEGRE